MNIVVTKAFAKDVEKYLTNDEKILLVIILAAITKAKSLTKIRDCKKLVGFKNAYRIKIGNYRIGFLFVDQVVKLSRLLNRKDVYKYFP